MKGTKPHHVDTDYSLERVPSSARKGFWSMFVIMLGFTFFSASMSVGAKIGNGLDLHDFLLAVVIGEQYLGRTPERWPISAAAPG